MAQPNGTFNHHVMSDADQQLLCDRQPRRPYEGEFAGAYTQIESSTQANYSTQNPPTPVDFPKSVNYDRQPAPIISGRESPEPDVLFSMHRVHGADAAPARGAHSDEPCVDEPSRPYFPASSSDSSYQPSSNDVAVLAGLCSLQVAAREAVKAAERHADALDEFVTNFVRYMKAEETRNASNDSSA